MYFRTRLVLRAVATLALPPSSVVPFSRNFPKNAIRQRQCAAPGTSTAHLVLRTSPKTGRRACYPLFGAHEPAEGCDESTLVTRQWLVVGDGDLSYSASLAKALPDDEDSKNIIQLTASVLEEKPAHQQVYRNSEANTQAILDSGHSVRFGVDSTRLSDYFAPNSLHRIVFNFPHWPGKTNHRRNRLLVHQFFQSCASVLHKSKGQVHVALKHGQCGYEATVLKEWKESWTVPMLASEAGFLLNQVEPFDASTYTVSSHRGVDRPFPTTTALSSMPRQHEQQQQKIIKLPPRRYIFSFPNGNQAIPVEYQLACRHELKFELDSKAQSPLEESGVTERDLVQGTFLFDLIRDIAPDGICAEIPIRQVVQAPAMITTMPKQGHDDTPGTPSMGVPLLVCLVVYRGASQPLTREMANRILHRLETRLERTVHLTIRKRRLSVSKPFPYHLLDSILAEYTV